GRGRKGLDDVYGGTAPVVQTNAVTPVGQPTAITTQTSSLQQASGSSSAPQQVRLSSIAKVVEKSGPLAINHLAQFPAATISFNLAPGASLGDAVKAIRAAEREIGMPLSVQTSFQRAALAFHASLTNPLLPILPPTVTSS